MKQIIFTAILILAFCFACFAQTGGSPCPKINITAPESVMPEQIINASASFEKETQPSTSKFNWTIIIGNDVSKIFHKGIINLDSKGFKDFETIILLADSVDKNCQSTAMARVWVVPIRDPIDMDQYSDLSWNEERARLDAAVFEMSKQKDMVLFIYFYFDKNSPQIERKTHLINVLHHLSDVRRLEKDRIIFLISETDGQLVKLQMIPRKIYKDFICCDYITINAAHFDKLEKLFNPKLTKGRKN